MRFNIDNILAGKPINALPRGHFIGGEFVVPLNRDTLASYDPGSGDVFATFINGNDDDVGQAVSSAKQAFDKVWRNTAPVERGRILHRASELILENLEDLAIMESLDCGKPIGEARGDVRGSARAFEYYAGTCDKLQGDTFPLADGYMGFSYLEPIGVTAQIIPWNFPLSTAARGIAPALAAGCSVVAKPAEQTPFTALLLAEILSNAGLPDGVCNVITGTGIDTGAKLVQHPWVDHITFTGSVATGKAVMKSAADNVTRTILELGGKSPIVVLADCDQEAAIDGVMGAIFENAGQICSAGSRLVIEQSIHDEFVAKLIKRAEALSLGHGLRNPQLGPLNSEEHLAKVAGYIIRGSERGAEILTGGKISTDPQTGKGWFYLPTIVANRPPNDELVQEEVFGPVLTIQKADDSQHALSLANDCQFGLAAGIYTKDFSNAMRMAREIDTGQVYINEYFAGGIEVPFGGNKQSGFGREKGIEGLKGYCKVKSIAAKI